MRYDMAFPVVLEGTRTPNDTEQLGLTKREYFAAMAMQGFCANPAIFQPNPMSGWSLANCNERDLAGYARKVADSLIDALSDEKQVAP